MDDMSTQAKMNELRALPRGALRASLLRRLRTVGGSTTLAASRLGIDSYDLLDLLTLVGLQNAPDEIRALTVVELPPSKTFARWFDCA